MGPQVNLSLSADQRSRDSARKLSPPDSLTGITLILNQEDSPDVFQDDLELASNMGFTWIQIQYMTFTVDHSAHSFPVFDRRTPSFSRLAQSIRQCKDKDLKVSLHPVLLIQSDTSQHWRGEYNPLYLDKWWASYSKWMVSIATFCTNEDVDMLFVGSELSSLQNLEKYWSSLIGNVRSVYRGAVSYSANWDDWKSVSFHNDLDILGINGYFPLDRIGPRIREFQCFSTYKFSTRIFSTRIFSTRIFSTRIFSTRIFSTLTIDASAPPVSAQVCGVEKIKRRYFSLKSGTLTILWHCSNPGIQVRRIRYINQSCRSTDTKHSWTSSEMQTFLKEFFSMPFISMKIET